ANDRACLFLMDYPHRQRLKIYATVELSSLKDRPDLAEKLAMPGYNAKVERGFFFHLQGFDWNCPQHSPPRFSESELAEVLEPVRTRIETLERENQALEERLLQKGK